MVQTMALAAPPKETSRALELGCYMQMTPALALERGYREVRGGYYGPLGQTETKTVSVGGREIFRCQVDLFDAERDPFPYGEGQFDCVLACEIIEHLKIDPMHMLVEIHRILIENGALVITTPNTASLGSVMRLLHGYQSPQVYSCYPHPEKSGGDSPHVREYTPFELRRLLESAGFRIEIMFTDRIDGYEEGTWAYELLRRNGFDTEMRGEQIYCRAVKDSSLPVERYPSFLYET
jgi:SAM-dependent methyltransferase